MIVHKVTVDTKQWLAYIEGVAGRIKDPKDVLTGALRRTDKQLRKTLVEDADEKYTVDRSRIEKDLHNSHKEFKGGWAYLMSFKSSRAIGAIEFQHSPAGVFTTKNRPEAVKGRRSQESGVHTMLLERSGNKAFSQVVTAGNTHLVARTGGNRSDLAVVYGPSAVQMIQKAWDDAATQEYAEALLESAINRALDYVMKG